MVIEMKLRFHRHKWGKMRDEYQPKNGKYIAQVCVKCLTIRGIKNKKR